MIRITLFNIITFTMMIATASVIWTRFHRPIENNWPLMYYAGMVVYLKAFDGSLNPTFVYIGVVVALLLRFEFLGGFILKVVRALDFVILAYFMWRGLALLLML